MCSKQHIAFKVMYEFKMMSNSITVIFFELQFMSDKVSITVIIYCYTFSTTINVNEYIRTEVIEGL